MTNLILIGGGGHCTSCIDVIEQEGIYKIAGILDKSENLDKFLLSYRVIGTDDDIPKYVSDFQFLITVGQVPGSEVRESIYNILVEAGAKFAKVFSPTARISPHAKIGDGSIVLHHACVNANVEIGANCIINTGANVEHDCVIGNHSHISTNAVVNGNCFIGNYCFVGSNATIVQGISIPASSVVGAGAVVLKTPREKGIFIGNPAKAKM